MNLIGHLPVAIDATKRQRQLGSNGGQGVERRLLTRRSGAPLVAGRRRRKERRTDLKLLTEGIYKL